MILKVQLKKEDIILSPCYKLGPVPLIPQSVSVAAAVRELLLHAPAVRELLLHEPQP